MKKFTLHKIVALVICVFVSLSLYSEPLTDKVEDRTDGYRIFRGFSFESYTPSPIGLDKRIQDEVNYVIEQDAAEGYNGSYAIVGHSQGGLRVFAYTTELKKMSPAEYVRLQAVITVSGIDKGLLALSGGFPAVKGRLMNDVNIIVRGLRSAAGILDLFWIGDAIMNAVIPSDMEIVNMILDDLVPQNFSVYLKPALNGGSPDSMAELRDMCPQSEFINRTVSKTIPYRYKVQTGTEWRWVTESKKVLGVTVYYPVYRSFPVYTEYVAYKDAPVFGNEMPVGYIVGLDSNTLSMTPPETEAQIRGVIGGLETGFNVVYGVHIAKNCAIVGLLSNGVQYANDAKAARDWFKNFDGELNEIKCSTENDGLVAKESQFYPRTFTEPDTGIVRNVHTNVLGKRPEGYVGYPHLNHANIIVADEVLQKIDEMLIEAKAKRVY